MENDLRQDQQGGRRGSNPRGRGNRSEKPKSEFDQKVLVVRRVTRVVRGGHRFSFSLGLVIGNRRGKVGLGVGKAADISLAVDKALRDAKKNMLELALTKDLSWAHEVSAKYASSRVFIKPAGLGRGMIAGSAPRVILTLAGVRDVSAKILSKSKNKLNNARATMAALEELTV